MAELENDNSNLPATNNKFKFWLKRIGVAGFLFFLLKGFNRLAKVFLNGAIAGENRFYGR